VLHQIEQRPLGAGRHLHVEAGRGGDRGPEGGRPFVDQPQQIGELQSLFHADCLSPCSTTGQRDRRPLRRSLALTALVRLGCGQEVRLWVSSMQGLAGLPSSTLAKVEMVQILNPAFALGSGANHAPG
jgi:hypothetical protein